MGITEHADRAPFLRGVRIDSARLTALGAGSPVASTPVIASGHNASFPGCGVTDGFVISAVGGSEPILT